MLSLPLTPAQEQLLFQSMLVPGSSTFNEHILLRLSGAVDYSLMSNCFDALLARHEALRAQFFVDEHGPQQFIKPKVDPILTYWDRSSYHVSDRHDCVQRDIYDFVRNPFNLYEGPLIRAALVCLSADEHMLVIAIHHIVVDAWSWNILLDDLSTLYLAAVHNEQPILPKTSMSYSKFLSSYPVPALDDQINRETTYWTSQLEGLPATLDLPSDNPRFEIQRYIGARYNFSLDERIVLGLSAVAKNCRSTLFMVLTSAFNIIIYQYTRQVDIVIGTPMANRVQPYTESIVGLFMNTVVLRTNLSSNPTIAEVIDRTRRTIVNAYMHQALPFTRIVEIVRPKRDTSRSPIVQIMINFVPEAKEPWFPELKAADEYLDIGISKQDLMLTLYSNKGTMRGMIEYSTDLYTPTQIAQFVDHFVDLLESIVAGLDRTLSNLPLPAHA